MVSLKDLAKRLEDNIEASLEAGGWTPSEVKDECQHSRFREDKDECNRSIFQKEYDKVIFSDYFRSLANKTQVSPIPENDHTHTRMTHSLEVACVGYCFGMKLLDEFDKLHCDEIKQAEKILLDKVVEEKIKSNDDTKKVREEAEKTKKDLNRRRELWRNLPEILATACLVHDIGNPPFGHAGEESIRDFFKDKFSQGGNGKYKWENLELFHEEWLDLCSFDGNPNGFRIITRLAGKYPEDSIGDNKRVSLN